MAKPGKGAPSAKAGGNLGQSNSTAAQILGAIQGLSEIAGKIDEATAAALGAIATAQTNATGAVEGKKAAAIAEIKAAKPSLPSKNSAVEESDNYPVPSSGPF